MKNEHFRFLAFAPALGHSPEWKPPRHPGAVERESVLGLKFGHALRDELLDICPANG